MKKSAPKKKARKIVQKAQPKAIASSEYSCTKEFALFLLRVGLGWLFLYAGLTKLLDPTWSAAGFLQGAKTLPDFYHWLASPENIAWVNVLNKMGLTLVGAGLITGTLTRYAASFGILIMALYFLPGLDFPYVQHGLLVDDHIVYIFALFVLLKYDAGRYYGLDKIIQK